MYDVVSATLARPRFRTVLLLSLAGISFLLAVIGVYGMVAHTVARRLPELFGIPATDPLTYVAAPLALGLVATLAAWLPARRAARLAPGTVLRAE